MVLQMIGFSVLELLARSGGAALSIGPAPHAVPASSEERRAIEEGDDCKFKRSARLEAEDSPVSSIITSSIPKVLSGWYH